MRPTTRTIIACLIILVYFSISQAQDSLSISRLGHVCSASGSFGKPTPVGDLHYIPTALPGIWIMNLNDPASPDSIRFIAMPGSEAPELLLVSEDVLYVRLGRNRFEWYDVSDPAHPQFLGQRTTPENLYGLAAEDNRLVATGHNPDTPNDGWIRVFNIEDPANPEQVARRWIQGSLGKCAISNDHLYVMDNTILRTYTFVNSFFPEEVSTLFIPIDGYTSFYACDSVLHIAPQSHTRRVINLADPDYPVDEGNLNVDNQAIVLYDQLFVADTMLFLPSGRGSIKKLTFNEANDGVIQYEFNYHNTQPARHIATMNNNDGLLVNSYSTISHVSFSDSIYQPVFTKRGTHTNRITVGNNVAIISEQDYYRFDIEGVSGNDNLRIIDITDPSYPSLIDTMNVFENYIPEDMVMKNNILYLSLTRVTFDEWINPSYSHGFAAFDFSDPSNPSMAAYYPQMPWGGSRASKPFLMTTTDCMLFVNCQFSMVAFDITNEAVPFQLDAVSSGNNTYITSGVAARDSSLFFMTKGYSGSSSLAALQGYRYSRLGHHSNYCSIAFTDDDWYREDFHAYLRDNLLYVERNSYVENEDDVVIFDISDPEEPVEIATLDNWFSGNQVKEIRMDDSFIFVADTLAGISVYAFTSDTTWTLVGKSDMWGGVNQIVVKDDMLFTINAGLCGIYDISDALAVAEPKSNTTSEFLPTQVELNAPWPNPFNSSTSISWTLPQQEHVSLVVYDILGRRVRTLCNEMRTAGAHRIHWDGTNEANRLVSSGTYFLRLETESGTMTRSIHLVK